MEVFEIGTKVRMVMDNSFIGFIVGIQIRENRPYYLVSCIVDGKPTEFWLFDFEIETIDECKKILIGFKC